MFIDEVRINVKGGDGGNGCVSLHHEKFHPKGGPDGGNGGRGGSVILEGTSSMNTLTVFGKRIHFTGQRGSHGKGKDQFGRDGKDTIVKVPLGTVVHDNETGKVLGDIVREGQQLVVAPGGRGGKGNAFFATAFYRVPRFCEKGEQVEARWLRLELKLLADVGIIGLPNAGKSTFLSAISAAKPKIADYPFTTLAPNLGAVSKTETIRYIFADIPGLIEGAHEGRGIGDKFLRHISRTRMMVHLIDLLNVDPANPLKNYEIIRKEIELFDPAMAARKQVVAANKTDIPGTEEAFFNLQEELGKQGIACLPISAASGEGIPELLEEVFKCLDEIPQVVLATEEESVVVIDAESEGLEQKHFTIEPVDDYFVVRGKGPERMVQMLDLDNDEAVIHLQQRLRRMGVEDKLKKMGIKNGDFVVIGNYEFNYYDESHDGMHLPT
ncbi:MAG: GTPase ObgE [Firmicutes bacterium]|nr:GTPase ObgE [Bacillota bacterium]